MEDSIEVTQQVSYDKKQLSGSEHLSQFHSQSEFKIQLCFEAILNLGRGVISVLNQCFHFEFYSHP